MKTRSLAMGRRREAHAFDREVSRERGVPSFVLILRKAHFGELSLYLRTEARCFQRGFRLAWRL